MADTTDVLAIPYPEGGDAFSATIIENLAKRVDEAPGIESLTTVQIEALTGDLKVEGRVVYNTTTNKLMISNGTSFANIDAALLPLAGGTMSGPIAMGSQKITGLAAGTATGDAARYDEVVTKLPLAGGTMTGDLTVQGATISTRKDGDYGPRVTITDADGDGAALTLIGGKLRNLVTTSGGGITGTDATLGVANGSAATDAVNKGQLDAKLDIARVAYGGGAVADSGTTFTIGALPAGTSSWIVVAQALSGGTADYVKTSAPTATQFTAYTYDVSTGIVAGNIAWIAIAV